MGLVVGELVGFGVQLGVFLLLPALWYRVTQRRFGGFWRWLGLHRPAAPGIVGALAALAVLLPLQALLLLRTPALRELLLSPHTPSGRLHALRRARAPRATSHSAASRLGTQQSQAMAG